MTLVERVNRRLRSKLLKETGNHSESTSLPAIPGISVKIFCKMPLEEQQGDGSQQPSKRGHSQKKRRGQVKITVLTFVRGNK